MRALHPTRKWLVHFFKLQQRLPYRATPFQSPLMSNFRLPACILGGTWSWNVLYYEEAKRRVEAGREPLANAALFDCTAAQLEENSEQTGLSPSWSHTRRSRQVEMRLGLSHRYPTGGCHRNCNPDTMQPRMGTVSPFVGFFISQDARSSLLAL